MFKTLLVGGIALVGAFAMVACEASEIPDVALEDAEAELRAAVCDQVIDCECRGVRYVDTEQCHQEVSSLITELNEHVGTLEYDPSCMGRLITLYSSMGCSDEAPDIDFDHLPCRLLHGDKQVGASCDDINSLSSDCAPGLYCRGRFCSEIEPAEPQRKIVGVGQSCDFDWCDRDLYCDEASVCQLLPTVGEPCHSGDCRDARCQLQDDEQTRLCVPLTADGEQCNGHSQCASGNCPAGFCLPIPQLGEECFGACATGLECAGGMCLYPNGEICYARIPR